MYYWPDGPAPQETSDTAWARFAAEVYAAAAERAGPDRPAPGPGS